MKTKFYLLSATAFMMLFLAAETLSAQQYNQPNPCKAFIGTWKFTNGKTFEFKDNFSVNLNSQSIGKWKCDLESNSIQLIWLDDSTVDYMLSEGVLYKLNEGGYEYEKAAEKVAGKEVPAGLMDKSTSTGTNDIKDLGGTPSKPKDKKKGNDGGIKGN